MAGSEIHTTWSGRCGSGRNAHEKAFKQSAKTHFRTAHDNCRREDIYEIGDITAWYTICAVAFLSGIFASMGLGGGMVLIVYLTVFAGFSQLAAQGINLVFFIPIAIISLVLHTKNKLVEWKKAVPAVL